MAEPRRRNLNKTQTELADAAKENQQKSSFAAGGPEEPIFSASDKAVIGGYAPLTAVETAGAASKFLNTPRDISALARTPLVSSPNAISTFSKVATNPLLNAGRAASLISPLGIYTGLDIATGMIREDGKGISELTGDFAGNTVGRMLYGDGSQPAITPQERQAIAEGKNPNKPIYGMTGARNQRRRTIVDYEPLSQAAQQSLEEQSLAQEKVLEAPADRSRNPIELSFQLPDSTTVMERRDGTRFKPTEEQIKSFNEAQKMMGQPSVTRLGAGGSEGVVMNQAAREQFTPKAPDTMGRQQEYARRVAEMRDAARAAGTPIEERTKMTEELASEYFGGTPATTQEPPSLSELGQKTLANYDKFRAEGGQMTPELEKEAIDYAASMGRKFDPELGYSKEFFPEILETYREQRGIEAPETSAEVIKRQAREAREETEARRLAPTDPERQAQMEESSEKSRLGTISVGGKQVAATEENRAKRDLETAFKQEAEAQGFSGAARRQYVRDRMQEREEAQQKREQDAEDRAIKLIKDNLDIQTSEANLLAKRQKMLEMPDGVSPSTLSSLQKFLADNDVSFDPETGALTTSVDRFLLPNGSVNLSPDSPIMNILKGGESGIPIQGAELFLQTPPSVQAMAGEAKEGSYVRSEDGRVYQFVNGEFVHVA